MGDFHEISGGDSLAENVEHTNGRCESSMLDMRKLAENVEHTNGRCESSMLDSRKYARELEGIRKAIDIHGGSVEGIDDPTLLRFLRARSMHTVKAAKMFVQQQKWRASFVPLGYIPENEVTNELATDKVYLQGISKRGWPLMVAFASKHHPNKHDFEEFKRFVIHLLDKTIASAPSGTEKALVVLDLNNLGYKNVDVKGMITGFQLLQNYYPERLGRLYMVNTPNIFINVWKIISRFLDKPTREKIVFLESHEISEVLLAEVDADILPTLYGGKADLVLLQDVHLQNWPPAEIQ